MNIGDNIKGFGEITRMTESSVYFGEKRFAKQTIENKMKGIIYKESPDVDMDWSNAEEVDKYYNSFKFWSGVVRVGDSKTREILEVKNNKVFFNGEYYLPYYTQHGITVQEKKFLKDGFVFGFCVKIKNHFWNHKTDFTVNVFYIESEVSDEEVLFNETKSRNRVEMDDISYLKSLNLNKLNGKDLHLLQSKFVQIFDPSIFPYTVNKVTFEIDRTFRDTILVTHRNRKGTLKIDNGYFGSSPFKNDYYAIVVCNPCFTNECQYQTRCERQEITFDTKMFDILSERVVKTWDRAIENNAQYR
jgi:hypothetical protein